MLCVCVCRCLSGVSSLCSLSCRLDEPVVLSPQPALSSVPTSSISPGVSPPSYPVSAVSRSSARLSVHSANPAIVSLASHTRPTGSRLYVSGTVQIYSRVVVCGREYCLQHFWCVSCPFFTRAHVYIFRSVVSHRYTHARRTMRRHQALFSPCAQSRRAADQSREPDDGEVRYGTVWYGMDAESL